jgi:hypothetical protein
MDPAIQSASITAFAAIAGSVVGGLASFTTSFFTQRNQAHRDLVSRDLAKRQELYSQFIKEATNLYIDSLDKTLDKPGSLIGLYSLVGRMRLIAGDEVLLRAEKVTDSILESYTRPPIKFEDLYKLAREAHVDPLKEVHGSLPRRAKGDAQEFIAAATYLGNSMRRKNGHREVEMSE